MPDEPTWDVPHRILAGVEYLVLTGEAESYDESSDPWRAFRSVVVEHAGWLQSFVRERPIQTNEPQRCWALLPLFLVVAREFRKPLDLLELGASAGLNLLWDRYRYEYVAGTWGARESALVLRGEERAPVPADLLDTDVVVRTRRGIDLAPVDARRETGLRLLFSFVPDLAYRDRVARAAHVLGHGEPPELIAGDYVDVLPLLLRERDRDSITVVFQTISTVYIEHERVEELRRIVDGAGTEGQLAWISTPTPEEHGQRRGDYPLELALWPTGRRRVVARMDNGGDRLEWLG